MATHLAHTSLLLEECKAAVSAGTNVMLVSGNTAAICQLQALSPVGRCKSFDDTGDGYGRGEGFAALTLRRQQQAQLLGGAAGGVYAVVRGSAVNQGGRSSGLTAPKGPAQTALVRAALGSGGLAVAQLGVVSVHGTGTPLGDPIEVGALAQALPGQAGAPGGITLLSNKSCYGHTEGTAGVTGLLLAVAGLHSQAAPQVMHLRNLNPYVGTSLADWARSGRTRGGAGARAVRQTAPIMLAGGAGAGLLAGSSSFGMSGVNAHMIVGQAGALPPAKPQVGGCSVWGGGPCFDANSMPAYMGNKRGRFSAAMPHHPLTRRTGGAGLGAGQVPRGAAPAPAAARCGGRARRRHLQLLAGLRRPGLPCRPPAVRRPLPAPGGAAGGGGGGGGHLPGRQRRTQPPAAADLGGRAGPD